MPQMRIRGLIVACLVVLAVLNPLAILARAQDATPAASCPAATPDESLAVVRRFFEAVNEADLTIFDDVVAPDVIYHGATVGEETGLEQVTGIYGEALTGFPDIAYTVVSSVAAPDAVAVRLAVEGVHSGDFRGLAPTGNRMTWNHSAFAHVACGKIVEMWAEIDQLDRLSQFGLLTAEGPAARMVSALSDPWAFAEGSPDAASCPATTPADVIA
ncbi:MAG: ester cyclase, partial [Chloroflexia bacterium]|nr:ester cyclase [Chloroflexia bacterium]